MPRSPIPAHHEGSHHPKKAISIFDAKIVVPAISASFKKLNPATLMRNPVMFVVEIVAALTTVILARDLATGGGHILFESQIVVWLWFTVLFANFAEAVAEGRGKAQADSLRKTKSDIVAKKVASLEATTWTEAASAALRSGDLVVVAEGDLIPGDGDVVAGIA